MSEQERVHAQWHEAMAAGEGVIDLGRNVFCDNAGSPRCQAIDGDWTDRPESGGFMFGSYAYCPWCAEEAEPRIEGYGETWNIRARCPQGMPFADWIRDVIREGNTRNKIRVGKRP